MLFHILFACAPDQGLGLPESTTPWGGGAPDYDDTGRGDTDGPDGWGLGDNSADDPEDQWDGAATGFDPSEYGVTVTLDALDWRDIGGALTPIRSQGSVGTCTAFAAVAALEAGFAIQLGDEHEDFSEQYLVNCTDLSLTSGFNTGDMADALSAIGTVDEAVEPYTQSKESCGFDADVFAETVYRIEGDEAIKQALQVGPLVTRGRVHSSFKEQDGVTPWEVQGSDDVYTGGHAVLLTGYDDEGWYIKNSWGSGFGDDGYGYIAFGEASWVAYAYLVVVDEAGLAKGPALWGQVEDGELDLEALEAEAGSAEVEPGDSVTYRFRVRNRGGSTRFDVGLYYSRDGQVSSADELVCAETWSIGADETKWFSATCEVPMLDDGTWTFGVVLDPSDDLDEDDEHNNVASDAMTVRVGSEPSIDLELGAVTVSASSPSPGDSLTVSGSCSNPGSTSSGSFEVGVYLSTDKTLGGSDTRLKSWTQSSISAGGSGSYSKSVTIPSSASGSYYVLVVADPSNTVSESDESDNTAYTSIAVSAQLEAVDETDTSAWCNGSNQDIFYASSISLSSTSSDPQVALRIKKCDGSSMTQDKSCHVRVGSYTGSYSSSLARTSFTWTKGSTYYDVSFDAWSSASSFASASSGDYKEFYVICAESSGTWNHWRSENPVVVEIQ